MVFRDGHSTADVSVNIKTFLRTITNENSNVKRKLNNKWNEFVGEDTETMTNIVFEIIHTYNQGVHWDIKKCC